MCTTVGKAASSRTRKLKKKSPYFLFKHVKVLIDERQTWERECGRGWQRQKTKTVSDVSSGKSESEKSQPMVGKVSDKSHVTVVTRTSKKPFETSTDRSEDVILCLCSEGQTSWVDLEFLRWCDYPDSKYDTWEHIHLPWHDLIPCPSLPTINQLLISTVSYVWLISFCW